MPEEGIELSPSGNILSNEEVIRLATLFVKSGVTKIRLTGGEPTVRKGISEIVGMYIPSTFILNSYVLHQRAWTSFEITASNPLQWQAMVLPFIVNFRNW